MHGMRIVLGNLIRVENSIVNPNLFISEDSTSTKHKAFEFAIKLMEGYVYRDCANAVYVPLYLTPYEQAVKYFPPFLKASTSYGYQIPEDLSRMMNKLFKNLSDGSSERSIKDKEFNKRMKDFSKQYMAASHCGCNKALCDKVYINCFT